MKICWFGIYDEEYSRNKILIDGLIENGVEVIRCNFRDKGLKKYVLLIKKLRLLGNEYDYVFCAFPAHVCIIIAFFFQKRPIITDAFVSQYESIIQEKKTHSRYHPYAMLYAINDRFMVWLSKFVIVDTTQNKNYFSRYTKKNKIHTVPVGIHTGEFYPISSNQQKSGNVFLVQFHGTYISLQGIENIILAAHILRDVSAIRFRLIGGGMEFPRIQSMVDTLKMNNINFLPFLSIGELNLVLNEADLILGIFGDTKKTDRVIPNKVFQGMAVCKPVLTKDTPAIRSCFSEKDLYLVSNNPSDIAQAIIEIYSDQDGSKIRAKHGYEHVTKKYAQAQIARQLCKIISE